MALSLTVSQCELSLCAASVSSVTVFVLSQTIWAVTLFPCCFSQCEPQSLCKLAGSVSQSVSLSSVTLSLSSISQSVSKCELSHSVHMLSQSENAISLSLRCYSNRDGGTGYAGA